MSSKAAPTLHFKGTYLKSFHSWLILLIDYLTYIPGFLIFRSSVLELTRYAFIKFLLHLCNLTLSQGSKQRLLSGRAVTVYDHRTSPLFIFLRHMAFLFFTTSIVYEPTRICQRLRKYSLNFFSKPLPHINMNVVIHVWHCLCGGRV